MRETILEIRRKEKLTLGGSRAAASVRLRAGNN
jgi:hypothetical protein